MMGKIDKSPDEYRETIVEIALEARLDELEQLSRVKADEDIDGIIAHRIIALKRELKKYANNDKWSLMCEYCGEPKSIDATCLNMCEILADRTP